MNKFESHSKALTCGTALLLSALVAGCADFKLCGGEPAAPPRAETLEPVVAAPAPRLAVLMPQPTRVTFSANTLFDFDKETLKPEGRHALDAFVAELSDSDYYVITVTGHTDRIGAHAYNQALSERRAEAVKSYLVESAGLAADKIVARGVDGSNPVTEPSACKGVIATAELIACLQPDRRVEIEVTGTR